MRNFLIQTHLNKAPIEKENITLAIYQRQKRPYCELLNVEIKLWQF